MWTFWKKWIFKDQPNGKCMQCKWNLCVDGINVDCNCPSVQLTNRICIMKIQAILLENVQNYTQNLDEGE